MGCSQATPAGDGAALGTTFYERVNLTRRSLLAEHGRLGMEIAGLAVHLRQATQVRDRVEIATQLKQAEAALDHLRSLL